MLTYFYPCSQVLEDLSPPGQLSIGKGLMNGLYLVRNMTMAISTMTQQKFHSMSQVSKIPTFIDKKMFLNLELALVHPTFWSHCEEQ